MWEETVQKTYMKASALLLIFTYKCDTVHKHHKHRTS